MNYLNNHCPERMGKTFFLDPPFLFWVGWKVLSPFLSQVRCVMVLLSHSLLPLSVLFPSLSLCRKHHFLYTKCLQATLNKVSFIKSSSKGDRRSFPEMFEVIDQARLEEEYGGQDTYVYDYEEFSKHETPPQ